MRELFSPRCFLWDKIRQTPWALRKAIWTTHRAATVAARIPAQPLRGGCTSWIFANSRFALEGPGKIRSPQIHPDGKRLFFTAREPNASDLWMMENLAPKVGSTR
jgi:hypothetical protein